MQSLHFLSKFGRWSSPRVTNVLKCGYIIQNRFLPITSISHFNPISSSNSFAVLSFFSQKCCHLLSEMHERREKAYLETFNEDGMHVEDCDTTLPMTFAATVTAANAEVVASSLHEVRSYTWKTYCCWNEGGSKGFVNTWWGLHCVCLRHAWSSWKPLPTRILSSLFTVSSFKQMVSFN